MITHNSIHCYGMEMKFQNISPYKRFLFCCRPRTKHFVGAWPENAVAYFPYVSLLESSIALKNPLLARVAHACIIKTRFEHNNYILNCLLNSYVKCDLLQDAHLLFDRMTARDIASWNTIISGYSRQESRHHNLASLGLFCNLQRVGLNPSQSSFVSVLVACGNSKALTFLFMVHGMILKSWLRTDVTVLNCLVITYAKCGIVEDACQVFELMAIRDEISWKVMLSGFLQNGCAEMALKFVKNMLNHDYGDFLDVFSFSGLISICGCSGFENQGRLLHGFVIKLGLESNISVANSLMNMYAKNRKIGNSWEIFVRLGNKDLVSWNTMMGGCVQNGFVGDAVKILVQMQMRSLEPNCVTFASIAGACAAVTCLNSARQVHAQLKKTGLDLDVSVENAMLSMYVKNCCMESAHTAFAGMKIRNLVSWNAMISGLGHQGNVHDMLHFFRRMRHEGQQANSVTIQEILGACSSSGLLNEGKQIHLYALKTGLEQNSLVQDALITLYSKCGFVNGAYKVFSEMDQPCVVSWNMMIAGFIQGGYYTEALDIFFAMQRAGIRFNEYSLAILSSSFVEQTALTRGQQIHAYVVKSAFEHDTSLANSLVSMYVRCGAMDSAINLFTNMAFKDSISWTAMIAGFSQHGDPREALSLAYQMFLGNIKMSHMTFVSILSACSCLARFEQGLQWHTPIVKNGLGSNLSVCNALITMYGKCGSIDDASRVFNRMAEKDLITWNAMITSLAYHGISKRALLLFEQMQEVGISPSSITYVGILYACTQAGLVDEGLQYFASMLSHGITPTEEHYSCIVGLLAKFGRLTEAKLLVNRF